MRFSACMMSLLFIMVMMCFSMKADDSDVLQNNDGKRTVVDYFGFIHVKGNKIVDQNDTPVALHGMSLFWSQWGGRFYNADCIRWLRDDWKCTVVRAVCGIQFDGYLENPKAELAKISTVIDACIDLGIYVIVDWHDYAAEKHLGKSKEFFRTIAQKYGNTPNLIYEIYNEPLKVSWDDVIKLYAEEVLKVIRQYDPDNLVIVGTPHWSQDVDVAARKPILDTNIAYAFHFYSSDDWHKQNLRDKVLEAMKKGAPIFITEYGLSEADGNGALDTVETTKWFSFVDEYSLSTCNWSISDKPETSAAFVREVNSLGGWKDSDLSLSGKIIRNRIRSLNGPLFEILKSAGK